MSFILVIEDNELNQDLICRRLRKNGYEYKLAKDGLEGLQMARELKPKLILLDLSLPMIDGFEIARELRKDPANDEVKIIALTAHALNEQKANALAAGCDEFETKPIDFKRLLTLIQKYF